MTQAFLAITNKQDGRSINQNKVTVGTTTPTADIFLQIDLTTHTPTRQDVLLALEAFKHYIYSNGFGGGGAGVDLPNS